MTFTPAGSPEPSSAASLTGHWPLPRRPQLIPGALVVRRGDGYIQVGRDPGPTAIFAESAAVLTLLTRLHQGDPVRRLGPEQARILAELLRSGLLIDGASFAEEEAEGAIARGALAATYAEANLTAGTRLQLRRRRRVLIEADLPFASWLEFALTSEGVPILGGHATPDLAIVVAVGEVDRARTDDWMSRDVPHLPVLVGGTFCRIGPLVVPGQTPCIRCVDAAAQSLNPRYPLLIEEYLHARQTRQPLPTPVSLPLALLGLSHALLDIVAFLDGARPLHTWEATIDFLRMESVSRTWTRHPECGCALDGAGLWQDPPLLELDAERNEEEGLPPLAV